MALQIIVASTEMPTAPQTVRDDRGTTSTADEASLTAAIQRAGAWAEGYVGYPLMAAKYRETVASYGGRSLLLRRTPVRAVSALYLGTDTGDSATIQITSTEFGVEAESGKLTRPDGWAWMVPVEQDLEIRPVPGQEFRPWLVDYVAGWTLDGISTGSALWSTEQGSTSTGRTLPYDVEAAVIERVVQKVTGTLGVSEKAVGDLRIKYGTGGSGSGLSGDPAAAYLAPYRRTI